MLDATFEIGDGRLALVGVRHRQHDLDARVVGHWLRGGQDEARKRAGLRARPTARHLKPGALDVRTWFTSAFASDGAR